MNIYAVFLVNGHIVGLVTCYLESLWTFTRSIHVYRPNCKAYKDMSLEKDNNNNISAYPEPTIHVHTRLAKKDRPK